MIRKTSLLFTIVCIWFLAAACTSSKEVELTSEDDGSQVEVRKGEQLMITLEGNPSTGYSWETQGLDTNVFEQVGDPIFVSSNPDLIGSGGTITLTFNAIQPGTTTINLVYHRPWETDVEPLDTFTVTATVK
jgi:inhibitor of cysteine peptidase